MRSVRVGAPEDDLKFPIDCGPIWEVEKMARGVIRETIRNSTEPIQFEVLWVYVGEKILD